MGDALTYGSVCSGIEAATVAWHPLGWRPAWFAEIEPFPSAVLAHHYPAVHNLGDMTAIARRVLTGDVAAPDILVGGTPCQAFSVAGERQSLADDLGNLTLRYVELVHAIDYVRLRAGKPPVVVVWENVPGVLSTRDNAFGCFLGGVAGEDGAVVPAGKKWTNAGCVYGPARAIAWRTLDAQYFGLAQRRRRVFVVASARNGFDPAQVLLEWDRLRRDSAPRRTSGESAAASLAASAGHHGYSSLRGDGSDNLIPDVSLCLNAGGMGRIDSESESESETMIPVAFDCKASGLAGFGIGEVSSTMRAMGHTASHRNGGGHLAVAFQSSQSGVRMGDTHATLDANNGPRRHNGVVSPSGARRLTPTECERLQGFPDGYTLIPYRNGFAADGPRYKALGNSMATNVMAWIGQRIDSHIAIRSAA